MIGFLFSTLVAAHAAKGGDCSRLLEKNEIPVMKVWEEPHRKRFKKIGAVNGILAQTVAQFFKSKSRFPLEFEIVTALKKAVSKEDQIELTKSGQSDNLLAQVVVYGLKAYFRMEGAAPNLAKLYALSVRELNEVYGPYRLKVAKQMAKSFATRLRFPSFQELAEINGTIESQLKTVIGDPAEFVEFAQTQFPKEFYVARQVLVKAFLEDMRQSDRPQRLRTRSTTPDLDSLMDTLKRMRRGSDLSSDVQAGSFTRADLLELLGGPTAGQQDLSRKPLFGGGVEELENYARELNPTAFQSHRPKYFSIEAQKRLVTALENSHGALVTSYASGFPLEEKQLEAMIAYAEDRDFVIILYPELGILDGLDERFLNHPRIFLLTHTIENSALKLWNIPIGPKQMNPLASLDYGRSIRTGQTTVVGSPQQVMSMLPRVGSDLRETAVWTPGSLSVGVYPARLPIQERTSYLSAGRHLNGFLVLEKSNRDVGPLKLGAQNSWHVRNVEVTLQTEAGTDDSMRTVSATFNDYGSLYFAGPRGVVRMRKGAQVLVLGDLHDHVTLQSILPHLEKYIRDNPDLEKIILHDPLDGYSHNRHEKDKFDLLFQKLRTGQLDMLHEYLDLVQTVNAFLLLNPALEVVMVDSNHSYWGKYLAESLNEIQRVVNGEFLAEVHHAMVRSANPARDPLHYIFDPEGRELYLSRLSDAELRQTPGSNVRVVDPNRVKVLPYGSILSVGSSDRPVFLHIHGHLGLNGAKGSSRAHAVAGGNAVSGDSHRSELRLDWMNVGTLTPKKLGYNDGGYSNWSQSWGIVYADGTKQLLIYNEGLDAFRQVPEEPVVTGPDFFGGDRLKVVPNPNEVFDGAYKVDQYTPDRRTVSP